MNIDVVYLCIQHSTNKHIELRYSLRSLELYLSGVKDVYVVGFLPKWCQNVIHISKNDIYKHNKDANIIRKVYHSCQNDDISDPFLFINDDHFLTQSFKAIDFPYYYNKELHTTSRDPKYRHRVNKTKELLKQKNLPIWHYDIHTPILIHKKEFLEAFDSINYVNNYIVMKSWYMNHWFTIDNAKQISDCKFSSTERQDLDKLKIKVLNRPCFSTYDMLSKNVLHLMQCLYTYPSKYEK